MDFHQKLNILIEEELKAGKSVKEVTDELLSELRLHFIDNVQSKIHSRVKEVQECMEGNDEPFLNAANKRDPFYQCDMMPKEDKGEGFTPIK